MKKLNIMRVALGTLLALMATGATAYAAGPAPVDLGMAGNYVVLSKTGISTTGTTMITGDIGVSPAAATYLTGFGLIADSSNVFSTSAIVAGKIYAATYAVPTPANLTTAVNDMQTAYTNAAGRTLPTATELGAGDISGLTIAPGLYKWGTGVSVNSDVTLAGSANDVWIFQIAQGLTVASGKKVILSGGAQAKNIFWQVGSSADIGTTAQFNGNILAQTSINLRTGATLNGRALAQTAVTLDANTVTTPGSASATPALVVTPVSVVVVTPAPVAISAPVSTGGGQMSQTTTVTPSTSTTVVTGCENGNKFSIITGKSCVALTAQTWSAPAVTAGCENGNKFSIVTGKSCVATSASAFGKAVSSYARSLKVGSRGDDVTALQNRLTDESVYTGPVTGYFGPLTAQAVKKFQAKYGISQVGIVGPQTRTLLNK